MLRLLGGFFTFYGKVLPMGTTGIRIVNDFTVSRVPARQVRLSLLDIGPVDENRRAGLFAGSPVLNVAARLRSRSWNSGEAVAHESGSKSKIVVELVPNVTDPTFPVKPS